ncbi:hypothetical protein LLH00_14070 [bacterium]|nr:hypothetical protein [bacterium]
MPKKGLFLALALLGASAVLADDHPTFYVDEGACPFECCQYGDWGVEQETKLYAEPKSGSSVVGIAKKGTRVIAQTGEVHTKPGKIIVKKDYENYREGDVLWVYTYLGEGYFKIWYKGEFIDDEIDISDDAPSPDDWGSYEFQPVSVWWVRIQTKDGIVGWSNEPDHFSDKDACG